MIIHLATDHAGFEHKQSVLQWLKDEGFEVVDHGAATFESEDDFTDYISKAALAVSKDPVNSRGVIFGGSGQGEAMIANRYPHVRSAVFYGGDEKIVKLSRIHNDSNIISIGARFVDLDITKKVIWDWLKTKTSADEKYSRRNKKIESLTKGINS